MTLAAPAAATPLSSQTPHSSARAPSSASALPSATTAPPAEGGFQPRCAAGAVRAERGLAVAGRSTGRAAAAALEAAIRDLGPGYAPAGTIDDTGMRLALADGRLTRGRTAEAAALRRRVLAERLALCRVPGAPAGTPGAR